MCLGQITSRRSEKNSGVAWKLFDKNVSTGNLFQAYMHSEVPVDSWLTATDGKVPESGSNGYERGFHMYATKKAALARSKQSCVLPCLDLVVVKVHYANVVARGYEDRARESKIIVAKKMCVLSEDATSCTIAKKAPIEFRS